MNLSRPVRVSISREPMDIQAKKLRVIRSTAVKDASG